MGDENLTFWSLLSGSGYSVIHTQIQLLSYQIHCLLEVILFETERYYSDQPYLETLYKAIFSLAYYGLTRIGELSLVGQHCRHTVKALNVHVTLNKNKFLIMLYSSKTRDKESMPQRIIITEDTTSKRKAKSAKFFCPFRLMRAFIKMRGGYINSHQNWMNNRSF